MQGKSVPLDYMAIQPSVRGYTSRLVFRVMANKKGGLLGDDYFRVVSLEGQEQVSKPYHFTVSLRANAENKLTGSVDKTAFGNAADASNMYKREVHSVQGVGSALLGQWAQVTVGYEAYPAQGRDDVLQVKPENLTFATESMPERCFAGIVASLSQGAPGEYSAEIMSPLHPLTLRNQYTVHKNLTIAELICQLLTPELLRYGTAFHVDCSRIEGVSASRTQDWLQAGETDYAMLQRILAKAAVHFYFVHQKDKLTLVFSNQATAPNTVSIPGCANGQLDLRYSYSESVALGLQQNDLLCGLNYRVEMVPASIETVLVKQPATWETNEIASYDSHPVSTQRNNENGNYIFYKNFTYGVNQEELQEVQQKLLQEAATGQGTLTGQCTSTLLSPGYTFTLKQMAFNPTIPTSTNEATAQNLMPFQFSGQVFVVTKISHKVTESSPYSGSLEATAVELDKANTNEATLLTPLSIHDTHQGSILATVVASAVPRSVYFMNKGDFSTEVSAVDFNGSIDLKQIGCVVKFATDEGSEVTHWVALSDSSSSAPAVNSIVMVGRGNNESEIPQIQQVVSSHGQKTIQPAFWRNNSWTFNTNWGSSCNTSYGDSMSIHYNSEAVPDLPLAMNIVQSAYENPSVLGAYFGGSSYSQDCSFSYSTTENGAKGLASASVSQGSHFSESHSDQDYSVSYNNTRQSFSKSNKSVNISYQGPFTDTIDEQNLSFINGKIPNQNIIDICNGLPDGSSYSENYTVGTSTSISTFEGMKSDTSIVNGLSESFSTFSGGKSDTSIVTGVTTSMSTFDGDKSDTSIVNGLSESFSTFSGGKSDTSTVMGVTTSDNTFLGAKSDTSSVIGASVSTTTKAGIETIINNVGGLKTYTEDVGGVSVETKNGTAAAHTDERVIAKQIAMMNITVEGVLSIL